MGQRGPRKKPAESRAREGGTSTRGEISHRRQPEPLPIGGRIDLAVDPPADMSDLAREVWTFLMETLRETGILAAIDLPLLRTFCEQVADEQISGAFVVEPFDAEEDRDLEATIGKMEAVSNAIDQRILTQLRAGIAPEGRDVNAAERYARTLTQLRAYRTAKRRLGNRVAMGSMGQIVEHPLVGTRRNAAALLLRFAGHFALTPAARADLGLTVSTAMAERARAAHLLGKNAKR